ncbi:DUF6630 family protein [Nocardia aurea]|uniref:DUF6630 family protein n=1 Tax=Nocardia aurea TaxID=2144174 RepID=UPI0033BD4FB3
MHVETHSGLAAPRAVRDGCREANAHDHASVGAIALVVLTVTMNDRAARLLGLRNGFAGLDPDEELVSGLRTTWVDGGIACRGEVVCWAPVPAYADDAPGRQFDLTGWECFETKLHLEEFVPVERAYPDGPIIGVDAQRTLLRQGVALAREVGRLAGELSAPIPLRCIISTGEANGTFRFHRIRPEESWLIDDLDSYSREYVVVVDFLPGPAERFRTGHIGAAQRAALIDLVELLAPDVEKARGRLECVLENASWSAFDPEDALIEALLDGVAGGFAYFHPVLADPEAIRGYLTLLPACPEELIRNWHDGDIEDAGNTATDLQTYLRSLGDHCRAIGTALIGVFCGEDGLVLGFLPEGELERFIALAATAEVEVFVHGSVDH